MSGEVHFHLFDYVNGHNIHYCRRENPWSCMGLHAISLMVMVTV